MRRAHILLYIMLTSLIFSACSREDDINEIFYGKTWYMTNIVINGTFSQEMRNFYSVANTYHITFSAGTFNGVLSEGVNISGTWSADGKHQTIHLTPDAVNNLSHFDSQIYHILEDVTAYSSGAEFLHLADANGNKILFGISRTIIYN